MFLINNVYKLDLQLGKFFSDSTLKIYTQGTFFRCLHLFLFLYEE